MTCPCGVGEALETCCGPFLVGKAAPPTAEQLMRSRYTAFALGNVDYIINTHDPETAEELERSEIEIWSKESDWLGLQVLRVEGGAANDEEAVIDFSARYKLRGLTTEHRERAQFLRLDGKWMFHDGIDIPREKKAEAKKWVSKGKKGKGKNKGKGKK